MASLAIVVTRIPEDCSVHVALRLVRCGGFCLFVLSHTFPKLPFLYLSRSVSRIEKLRPILLITHKWHHVDEPNCSRHVRCRRRPCSK